MDYDLIIIGHTPEAIYAAKKAVYLKARVALVEQPSKAILGGAEITFKQTWYHFLKLSRQWENLTLDNFSPEIPDLKNWSQEVNLTLEKENSLANLAVLGVDIIPFGGEFCRQPQLGFRVKDRYLRSPAYLITTGAYYSPLAAQAALKQIGYLTLTELLGLKNLTVLPQNLVIIGDDPSSLEIAQILARIGKNITLITNKILPKEDPEVSRFIQAQLEADQIKIISEKLLQIKIIEGKKWLQVGNIALETDEIIVTNATHPNTEGLNLEGVGVNWDLSGIKVNQKLQTTNPKIYACGNVIGDYNLAHVGEYEAEIAVKNCLFLPCFKVNYQTIPLVIFTDPVLAKVGLSETEAVKKFGQKVSSYQAYYRKISQAQLTDEITGFCKLIIRDDGKILGCYLVGKNAEELINLINLAIKNNLKITSLERLIYPSWTISEIISSTANLWTERKNHSAPNILQYFYNLRRLFSK
jgi:pyruvate/2-oxoglutarate dehydrogenase complex dihydrolipoamide dehydrogenase (E3) component